MSRHSLKLKDTYFDAVLNGIKTNEIRKNDRDYKVGDELVLRRVKNDGTMCADVIYAVITHILTHDEFPDGIRDGYVILSIKVRVYYS